MFPILGAKKIASVIVNESKNGETSGPESHQNDDSYGMEACAEKMMKAMESKDVKALASALKEAFAMAEASSEYSEE